MSEPVKKNLHEHMYGARLANQIMGLAQQLAEHEQQQMLVALQTDQMGRAMRLPMPQMPLSASTLGPLDVPTLYPAVKVSKIDEDEQLVFGWASVSSDESGRLLVDTDNEMIEPAELEDAVYKYVLDERGAGELHKGEAIGKIVESLVMTPEKSAAMGLALPAMTGWWVGIKIDDADVFAKVKDGTYKMFSIQGTATPEEAAV